MKHLCTLLLTISSIALSAQTWNQDIAPIVYEHCGNCHHPGGIAPSSLLTYDDASSAASEIWSQIMNGNMPPWPANPHYESYLYQNVLSDTERDAILTWCTNGTPQGTGTAPNAPQYNDGFTIANPDEIVAIPEYTVPVTQDVYRSFVMSTNSVTDRYIGDVEIIPGNNSIVHHVLLWTDTSNQPQLNDAADPGPGWTSSGGAFPSDNAQLVSVWVPGMGAVQLPQNLGLLVPAGSSFVIEVHYAPGSIGQTASVNARIKYKNLPTIREVTHEPLLYHYAPSLQEPALYIPANTTATFNEVSTVAPVALSFISVFPHMHLLGQTFKIFGRTLANDTIPMVDVVDYKFRWQFNYQFEHMKKLPAGSRIYGRATYDNTSNNPSNPSNPPQNVGLGENTTDEMMVAFFMYLPYQAGDENIDMMPVSVPDFVPQSPDRVLAYPNPANDKLYIDFPNTSGTVIKVYGYDAEGKRVNIPFLSGNGRVELDTESLSHGLYQVFVETRQGELHRTSFVKN
jgi:hypothetical protein